MDITKVILVRHGQSIGNLTRRFLGHTDMDLSELGYLQAKTTANALKNEKIDIIYSSDLKRAYNTALPHGEIHNLNVICRKNLREAYVGEWEGLLFEEITERWGREVFPGKWSNDFGNFIFPGGESIQAAGERFLNEIITICEKNKGKTILICAHAAVIRSFWAKISNILPDDVSSKLLFPTNASYSICHYSDDKIVPVEYSHDEHLSEVGITRVHLK